MFLCLTKIHQKIGVPAVKRLDTIKAMGAAEAELKPSECAEKIRLISHYQVATADYSRAVQVLSKKSGTMRKAKYVKIREYAETARLLSETARAELDQHTAEHGC